MNLLLIGIILLMLCYISFTDMKRREIDNIPIVIIFLLSIFVGIFVTDSISILIPTTILVVGIILSSLNLLGGGDVKLLFALTVGLSSEMIYHLFILTSFAGIPVAIIAWVVHKFKKSQGRCEVPYGLAISLGYILTLLANDIKLF